MKYVRTNVYDNGGDFSNPVLLWYARGVKALKARALDDPTSWRFFGAIHGINPVLWRRYGYLSDSDKLPSQGQIDTFWDQCQHGTWYFLPWHRGYLLAIEATVRDAVVAQGGPEDWALPYWNYFAPDDFRLPPAFATPDWPDGTGDNPLFVPQRWGPNDDGNVYVPLDQVNMDALTVPEFTGVASGGDPGFGGVDTGFAHNGNVHGDVETQPHDWVHGLVGGADPENPMWPGLMSTPPAAALDPIFWLHHANIDRLWEVWLQGPVAEGNPTDPAWIDGPASLGQRAFVMPWPPSGSPWTYTPGDMENLAQLDYVYDNLSPDSVSRSLADRYDRLRVTFAAPEGDSMTRKRTREVELVGAHDRPVPLVGGGAVRADVRLDAPARDRMTANLSALAADEAGEPATAPERVFLNLENVRGLLDAVAFRVYVNVPDDADPADFPERLAGSIALFGVTQATERDDEHSGQGLTFVLDITRIVHALHLEDEADADALAVRIVPVKPVPAEAQVSIGRVSVFRQGA
jgi:tyrosinase